MFVLFEHLDIRSLAVMINDLVPIKGHIAIFSCLGHATGTLLSQGLFYKGIIRDKNTQALPCMELY